ncbi:MAG: tetratricopeptide repeat protein, partial [Candidatus Helarchaeota archaeon]|nr:tetratricopeptide repeat protein [Candidatus Helarchaeota archaeon]
IQKYNIEIGQRPKSIIPKTRNIEILVGTLINEYLEYSPHPSPVSSTGQALPHKGGGIKGGDDFYIILDDYHHLQQNKEIDNGLDYLLHHLPANLHLIIASRSLPSLNLAYYFAKQDLFKLTREQLQFTSKDIQLLLKEIYGLNLPAEEISRIEKHSEGWITAIQLILQKILATGAEKIKETLNGYLISGEEIFNYFAREVFENQPKKIQEFLMKTSIFEYMNGEICKEIFKGEKVNTILKYLVTEHVFTTKRSFDSYKYHPLFKQFLFKQCREVIDKKQIFTIHQKAADYFLKIGEYNLAIKHYSAINQDIKTAQIIEKIAERFFEKGNIEIINHWLSILPDKVVKTRPKLLIVRGDFLSKKTYWHKAKEAYLKAKRLSLKRREWKELCSALYGLGTINLYEGNYQRGLKLSELALKKAARFRSSKARARILNLLGIFYGYTGNYQKAIMCFKQGLRIAVKIEDRLSERMTTNNLGNIYDLTGDFMQALVMYQRAITIAQRFPTLGAAISYRNAAGILTEKGEYKKAEVFFKEAKKLAETFNDEIELINIKADQAELLSQIGRKDKAMKIRYEVLELAKEHGLNDLYFEVLIALAEDYRTMGNYYKSEGCFLEISTLASEREQDIAYANYLLSNGLLVRDMGKLRTSIRALNQALKIYLKFKTQYEVMQVYYYLADIHLKSGNIKKTRENLNRALNFARDKNYDYFVINQPESPRLLSFAIENKIDPLNYAQNLFAHIKEPSIETSHLTTEAGKADLVALLFGKLELYYQHRVIERKHWRTKSLQNIFAYLLINPGKKFRKDELIDLFWPKLSPLSASMNLRSAFYHIRETMSGDVRKPERLFIIYEKG